jgi:hypothetical protein
VLSQFDELELLLSSSSDVSSLSSVTAGYINKVSAQFSNAMFNNYQHKTYKHACAMQKSKLIFLMNIK